MDVASANLHSTVTLHVAIERCTADNRLVLKHFPAEPQAVIGLKVGNIL